MDLSQALEIVSSTDPGMVRSHNEDSIAADASMKTQGTMIASTRAENEKRTEKAGATFRR